MMMLSIHHTVQSGGMKLASSKSRLMIAELLTLNASMVEEFTKEWTNQFG